MKRKKERNPTTNGKIDVAKKYNLKGGILSQEEIDKIVKKYKKK